MCTTAANKLADRADPLFGHNHLTPIRWILAGLVALGHIWGTATGHEPFRIHQWTGSYMAVNGFFVLSGLLIMKSLATRNNLKDYATSRILRIYPAFIVIMLAFAFIFAPFFSKPGGMSNAFTAQTWVYVFKVLAMGDTVGAPGGVFKGNIEEIFNGSLWTIRFELAAYILAAVTFAIGLSKQFGTTFLMWIGMTLSYIALPLFMDTSTLPSSILPFMRLSSCFLLGMVLWHWPAARRPPWWAIGLMMIVFLLIGDGIAGELLATLSLTGLILRLGLSKRIYKPLLKLPDYSYGIYIWHYPILQSVIFLNPDIGPFAVMVMATPLIILISGLSWHVIEKPALGLKKRLIFASKKAAI